MSPEQEKLGEALIQAHKDNKGFYHGDFVSDFNSNHDERLAVTRALFDIGLIKPHTRGTFLTQSGWAFTTFEAEREKARRAATKADKGSWANRNWWVVAIVTAVLPAALTFVADLGIELWKEQRQVQTREKTKQPASKTQIPNSQSDHSEQPNQR